MMVKEMCQVAQRGVMGITVGQTSTRLLLNFEGAYISTQNKTE